MRLEFDVRTQALLQCNVVVDLAVDSKDLLTVFTQQGLSASIWNGSSFSVDMRVERDMTHQHQRLPNARVPEWPAFRHSNLTSQDLYGGASWTMQEALFLR